MVSPRTAFATIALAFVVTGAIGVGAAHVVFGPVDESGVDGPAASTPIAGPGTAADATESTPTDSAAGSRAVDANRSLGRSAATPSGDDATASGDDSASTSDGTRATPTPTDGDANEPPTAAVEVGLATVAVGEGVLPDAWDSTDPDGEIASVSWTFGDGETATGIATSHTYDEPGTYEVTATVTDDDGATDVASVTVTVEPAGSRLGETEDPSTPNEDPPTEASNAAPSASIDAGNLPVTVGDLVWLEGSSTDEDGVTVSRRWEFGDGSNATGRQASHVYEEPGTYAVTLTVVDDDGAATETTTEVTVGEEPSPDGDFERLVERAIHERINEIRRQRGRDALGHDDDLAAIARNHSEHMVANGYVAHTRPDGTTVGDRYDRAGYECSASGENIAMYSSLGDPSPEEYADELVGIWMNSTGHRENLLRERWVVEGIGVERAGRGVYATQNFC